MRFAACPVFPALPGELKRTREPRRRQSGCIGTPALSGNWKPFDIAGTAKTNDRHARLYRFAASVCLGRRRPRAGRGRAASSLSASSRACSCTGASPTPISTTRCA
jgi:hypothetical protein